MLEVFRRKNILAPEKRVLLWSIFCWVMYELGFALLLEPFFDLEQTGQMYWYQIANFCASFILTVLCFMPFLKESIAKTDFKGFGRSLLIGGGLYLALTYAVNIVIVVLDLFFREPTVDANGELVEQLLNQRTLPMIVCTVLLVPVTEECLVRGVLFAPICRHKPWLAYALSAFVFAFLHVMLSIAAVAAEGSIDLTALVGLIETFLVYLPSGIVLGWMYQRTGTIIGPLALHSLNNLFAVITILWAY